MTLLNYWHYITFVIVLFIFIGGIVSAFKQEKKIILPMILSVTIISILLAGVSVFVIDKYTKKVELYKLKNKRLLSTEQIIYTGRIKNVGNHKVGKVRISIKLVNRGAATGNVKGGNFYKPSGGLLDFFSGMNSKKDKVQKIEKEFLVARNLKPGTSQSFRVHFKYPGYFRSVAQFTKLSAH